MAETSALAWRATLTRRVSVAAAVLLLWSAAIEARLVYLQVVAHADLAERASRQQRHSFDLLPARGELLDREGRVFAYSVDAESIYADPRTIADPAAAAAALCGALRDCTASGRRSLATLLAGSRSFAWVRRQAAPDQAVRVAALGIDGVGFMNESRRWYPNKDLAAHVLGFVGVDHTGLGGLEARYESFIKGEPGTLLIHRDARRQVFSRVERPPASGDSLELTLDTGLQHVVERELRAGVRESGAAGGSAIVMDPSTGEILAMANYPTFNPNAYQAVHPGARRNRAIHDLYEPGSTFKVFMAGAALEEGVIAPSDPLDVSAGSIRIGSRVITDAVRHDGMLSFEDVIVESSNVGAVMVGLRLGADRLHGYVRRFGFGRPSSPDFQGENAGIVWDPSELDASALASMAIGYQIGVTPLQMVAGFSAIANGGTLLEPRVVRAVIRDGQRLPVPRRIVDRPIGARTAAQLTTMMEGVVARGTAQRAQVPGYTVAGKTGTAQKLVGGQYSTTDYNVSFVGYVPSRQPVFTIAVVIDTPQGRSRYGGVVAAPIFQRIASEALRQYGVPPTVDAPPPLVVVRGGDPLAHVSAPVLASAPVHAVFEAQESGTRLPDLIGLSARDAIGRLAQLGITPRLLGDGLVIDQRPAAGTPLDGLDSATLWLARRPPADRPAAAP